MRITQPEGASLPWAGLRASDSRRPQGPAHPARPAGLPPVPGDTDLRTALAGLRPIFRRAGWFSLASGLLVLVPTAYMMEVYGRVLDSRNGTTLAMLTLLVLGAYLVMEVLELARARLLHEAGVLLDRQMSDRVFHASFETSLRQGPGAARLALQDLARLRDFLHSPLMVALLGLPVMGVFGMVLFAISPLLGATALAAAVLQGLITWMTDRRTQEVLRHARAHERSARALAEEGRRDAATLKALGMWPAITARWQARSVQGAHLQSLAQETAASFNALARLLQQVLASALLGLAAWLLLRDALPGGPSMMIVGSVLGARMLAPLMQVVVHWRSLIAARQSWSSLQRLLSEVPPKAPAMPLPAPRGEVTVEALVAAAPGQKEPVVRNVAFRLAPGEVVAILGPSGAGKSSLARVLLGVWKPLRGSVRLDGVDVAAWDKEELGPSVGFLPQEVELLEGSIADNIARFADASLEDVQEAARSVGLHDWIESLPQGYDTPVGPQGLWLSGGQRQRIGLARAFFGAPAWVVLDEPNASLDAAGEQSLLQTLQRHKARGATMAVITHRSGVLAACDKILVMRDGASVAFGPRDEVLAALAKPAPTKAVAIGPAKGAMR